MCIVRRHGGVALKVLDTPRIQINTFAGVHVSRYLSLSPADSVAAVCPVR